MKPWIFITLLLILGAPQHYRSDVHTANESARIYTAQAIVHHQTLSLNPVFRDYKPDWTANEGPLNVDVSVRDGQYLLDKAPGVSLLAVPIVALHSLLTGGTGDYASLAWLLTLILCALPCALFARFMTRWLGKGDAWSRLVPVPLVLATPWLAYAGLLFGHALAAVFVGLGSMLALGPLKSDETEASERNPFLGGICLGAAVLTEYTTALFVLLVCATLLCSAKERQRLIPIILGGSLMAIILMAWNWAAFGSPLAFSYSFKDHPDHAEIIAQGAFGFSWPHPDRLAGILFSAKRGLLFLAPWLLTSYMGAIWAPRTNNIARPWRIFLPLVVFGIPIIVSGFVDWEAGDSMGPRHLIPALPIFGIASVLALRRLSNSVWIPLISGLTGAAFLMCFIGAYIFPYFPGADPTGLKSTVTNPLFELSLPLLLLGNTGRSIFDALLPSSLNFFILLVMGALILSKSGGFSNRAHPVSPRKIAIATSSGFFFLFLAIGPMTPGENALNQISRAQAFAHEHLNRNDLALQLYEGACARGDGVSCATAGKNLRDGLGVEKNPERARILLKIGCEFEDWRACRDLGKLVKWGVGGPQNPDEANNFFQKARRLRGQK